MAALNDEFRRAAGLTRTAESAVPGRCFKTAGVVALSVEAQTEILDRVQNFSDFKPAIDPHREHDFGSIALADGGALFWKIGYYADADMEYGGGRSGRLQAVDLMSDIVGKSVSIRLNVTQWLPSGSYRIATAPEPNLPASRASSRQTSIALRTTSAAWPFTLGASETMHRSVGAYRRLQPGDVSAFYPACRPALWTDNLAHYRFD